MAIRGELARIIAEHAASWPLMATDNAYREQVLTLVRLGISQKVLAREMGLSETWLGRWLANQDGRKRLLNTEVTDALNDYLVKLLEVIQADVKTQASADVVALMTAVKRIDANRRRQVADLLNRIANRQEAVPVEASPEREPSSVKPAIPRVQENTRDRRPSSRKKAAGGGRRRRKSA